MGDTKGGAFDLPGDRARDLLRAGPNPNGRPNSDVIVPWINGLDITRRHRDMFIVDFGVDRAESESSMYEAPFEHVVSHVKPKRIENRREAYAEKWWIHVEPRPAMRRALRKLPRFLVTLTVARHRTFSWVSHPTLPDHQLIVFARSDDFFFGIMHSRVHELWALNKGTQLEDRPRYTPSSTFETFPFPWALSFGEQALSAEQKRHHAAISVAAANLDQARARWLNPPELVTAEPDIVPNLPPRLVPKTDDSIPELKKRTLTKLYNEKPAWLRLLHEELDRLVLSAYGWPSTIADEEILESLLQLNHSRTD